MTSEGWKRIEAHFEKTLEAPPSQRPSVLEAIRDDELRREVESLLLAHGEAGAFIDEPDRFFSSESFEADTFAPGQTIERYRITREIGRGGMGAVFLAERADDTYLKQVALKVIKRGMDTDSVLRQFHNERQILAGFDHPNIARLLDGGTTPSGLPYFVMEYVEGLPIDEFCKRHVLSVTERLKLFREVCAAVSYAHRRLIIHRDIKRSNILITNEGTPKLLDFGIAKILQQGDEPLATITGMRLMTPDYASPEQLRGEPVTTASDVYSLGVVLYELLCGCSPYRGTRSSPHEIARVITEMEPTKPSTAVAKGDRTSKTAVASPKVLRGDLDNVVLMALRKEPERRYQSVEQFSEDIRRHLEERPVLACKDTLRYRSAKFVGRNKVALAAAALVLLSLIGGIVATSWQAHIATREKARAERRFQQVRSLAHSVVFDYHDAIKTLPGATKVRERLVKDALKYLDSLAGEAQGDAALQRELADAYERVGDVRGGNSVGSLGDVAGALESYSKALRIREAVLAADPGDTQARSDIAASHQKLGNRLLVTADARKGVEHLRKAQVIYLELSREQPGNDDRQLKLGDTCNKLGKALERRGDLAGALEQYNAALAIAEPRAARNPRDQTYRRLLWNTYGLIADVLFLQGDVAGAIEANRKALAAGEALAREDPINADYRRQLAQNYKDGGDYRKASDPAGALEQFRKAAKVEEELLVADPANALTPVNLGYTHKRIADFLANLDDYAQALSHFKRARELFEKVLANAPGDLRSRFEVATCGAGVAGMQARLGEVDGAAQECRQMIALLGQISEDPTNSQHRCLRAQTYEYIGYAYQALAAAPQVPAADTRQHWIAARGMFQESLNVLDDLRSRGLLDPADEQWARDIAAEKAKCNAALAK